MGNLLRAKTSFFANVKGTEVQVSAGEIFDDSHELVKRTPADWWEPLQVSGQTEQATAAPGEKRAARVRPEK